MKEVFEYYKKQINLSKILKTLKENKYFLVSIHREENVDNLKKLKTFLESIDSM